MSVLKQIRIALYLFFILFLTRGYIEVLRLFCFFLPVYICLVYFELRPYFSVYLVIRFPTKVKWQKKILGIGINFVYIGAIVLCIDKLINIYRYQNTIELAPLFLLYFVFLFFVVAVVMFPRPSFKRGILFSVALAVLAMVQLKALSFLDVLHDPRKWNISGGILGGIVILGAVDIIICISYFVINKIKKERVRIYV